MAKSEKMDSCFINMPASHSQIRTEADVNLSGNRKTCSSCGEPIMWASSFSSGKAMPLNIVPETKTIVIDTGGGLVAHTVQVFTSHFATCPDADKHRRG